MIVYEVNLTIERAIFSSFQVWLKKHVQDMVQLPGFVSASILKQEQEPSAEQHKLTVHYQLESREALATYFNDYAAGMREEGVRLFGQQYVADRRVFAVQENIL